MKRLCLCLVIISCLLLTACGAQESSASRELVSQRLEASQSLSFTATLRAEYAEKTARFTLDYTGGSSGAKVTVTAPSLIAGVTANIEPDSTSLQYDSVCLATGELDEFGLSPMSSLPMLVDALRSGALNSSWVEGSCLVMELQSTDELYCTVWFDSSLVPTQAELVSDGRVKVYMDISDWQCA
jgi:hypothetical protein